MHCNRCTVHPSNCSWSLSNWCAVIRLCYICICNWESAFQTKLFEFFKPYRIFSLFEYPNPTAVIATVSQDSIQYPVSSIHQMRIVEYQCCTVSNLYLHLKLKFVCIALWYIFHLQLHCAQSRICLCCICVCILYLHFVFLFAFYIGLYSCILQLMQCDRRMYHCCMCITDLYHS